MNTDRIVVIGASLGGLDALARLSAMLPAGFPAPIVVVLHLGSDTPRLVADIVGSFTSLTVAYASHEEPLQSGHIYLAPPGVWLAVSPERTLLCLTEATTEPEDHPADYLFESAAKVYGEGTIGIVMTGAGTDGARGMRAITSAGGTRLVQAPSDAVDPEMPESAIAGDDPNRCVPISELGPLLVTLVYVGWEVRQMQGGA